MYSADSLDNLLPDIIAWRRHLHTHPELGYEVHDTAAFIAGKLNEFGADEVITGIGKTGVVGVIKGRQTSSGKVIGLRADMDALPITEASGVEWSSAVEGSMHACGHDGHTAMLLGAAQTLCHDRGFDGTVIVIFQPAEESGAGALAMIDDGLMERFGIQEVYGLHNMPDLPVGEFAIRSGALMACADEFDIAVEGLGGHAAMPHLCIDTVVVASHIVIALQTIASRTIDPTEPVVVSVTTLDVDGEAYNVIPQTVRMRGTLRAFSESVRLEAKQQLIHLAEKTAELYRASATVDYRDGYPATINHDEQTRFAVNVASQCVGADKVNADTAPTMGAEDFSYMLNARAGAFIFMGNGKTAGLHHPEYDFNDDAIRVGCQYWLTLATSAMPLITTP